MFRKSGLVCLVVALVPSLSQGEEAKIGRFLQVRSSDAPAEALPPSEWSATKNVLWKTDIPGLAWSTPIVWGKRVYLTTCIKNGETREPQKGLYLNDLDANRYPKETSIHQWKVLCLDLETGSVIWERLAFEAVPSFPHHIKNTLASETPCTDGERIYATFGNVGLFCYDMEGKPLWSHPIEPKETKYGWGTSESPIVYKGVVYQPIDNEVDSHLLALDAKTGKVLWDVKRDATTNYSTPYIWETPERTELVLSGIEWCQSYDLSGKPLWQIKGKSILAIPVPFEHEGLLYVTSGHVLWGENPIYCVRPGASGDISPVKDQSLPEGLAWHRETGGPYHPTPLIRDNIFYVLYDRGFLSAYDAKSGEPIYERKRIPRGRAFTSSPWSYDGKLFAINEDGVTFIFKLGREFEILGTNELAADDMCMASPVIVGDKLLIRTSARLYCLQKKS